MENDSLESVPRSRGDEPSNAWQNAPMIPRSPLARG